MYATEKDIFELRASLESLLSTIKIFNKEFEVSLKPKLARGDASGARSKLGEVVEAAAQQRKEFNEVSYIILSLRRARDSGQLSRKSAPSQRSFSR